MHKGNPGPSRDAEAEQRATEHALGSALITKAIGLASASKWHDFGWRPTRRPGTRTGPKVNQSKEDVPYFESPPLHTVHMSTSSTRGMPRRYHVPLRRVVADLVQL